MEGGQSPCSEDRAITTISRFQSWTQMRWTDSNPLCGSSQCALIVSHKFPNAVGCSASTKHHPRLSAAAKKDHDLFHTPVYALAFLGSDTAAMAAQEQ